MKEYMDENRELWNKAAAFHGHICGGLAIGYKAAVYAIELLGLDFSDDEEVVCISENDACGVDAIQSILGCSVGKGNLLFHMRGKQVFSVYNRKTGKSVRLSLKNIPPEQRVPNSMEFYLNCPCSEMFDVSDTVLPLPGEAKIFDSYICERCGEKTGANWMRMVDGKLLCEDCFESYDRFHI